MEDKKFFILFVIICFSTILISSIIHKGSIYFQFLLVVAIAILIYLLNVNIEVWYV